MHSSNHTVHHFCYADLVVFCEYEAITGLLSMQTSAALTSYLHNIIISDHKYV